MVRLKAKRVESRSGFTFLELVVVLVIIMVLASILLPAISSARDASRKVQCQNNLRGVALGILQFHDTSLRFPASGYVLDTPDGDGGPLHSWAVAILPFIDQQNLYEQWDLDRLMTDPVNSHLTKAHIPVYICPIDITRNRKDKEGDLSYAVSGGWGYTLRTEAGVGDCPVDWHRRELDMNGDGVTCSKSSRGDEDRVLYKKTGLFFLENWKDAEGTVRHHSISSVRDGTSNTYLVGENVRTGFESGRLDTGFANPMPYHSAFYVGNPCKDATCSEGNVHYALSNAGDSAINSGLWAGEGTSPIPNSFHKAGVFMAYADGHVAFLNERIAGRVHAALASPQGIGFDGTPLRQSILSGSDF